MKIFITGSRYIEDNLPKTVYDKIDDHMDQGDEFLIGDRAGFDSYVQRDLCNKLYDYVTVYVSGWREKSKNNIGRWSEEYCPIGVLFWYDYNIERDFAMAEDADAGIVIWDGESVESFINMINLIFLGKRVDLYLLNEEKWVNIESLEDLKDYVGEKSGWTDADVEMVLTKCGFSMEMKSYLISQDAVNEICLVDIICGAPITLKKKSELLNHLLSKRNIKEEVYEYVLKGKDYIKHFKNLKKEIRRIFGIKTGDSIWSYVWKTESNINTALRNLEFGKNILNLYAEWYDADLLVEKSNSQGLFRTKEEVVKFIRREEEEYDSEEGWYRIEAWADIEGVLTLVYNYYLIKDEVCWFEKMLLCEDEMGNDYYSPEVSFYGWKTKLFHLKTPFKMGDIIQIDCRPFGPMFKGIVLEDEHQYDLSFPSILYNMYHTGEWEISSLKSGMSAYENDGSRWWSPLSPLYSVRVTEDDELTPYSDKLKGKDGEEIRRELCNEIYIKEDEVRTTEWIKKIFGM